jgi:hypothetical protein
VTEFAIGQHGWPRCPQPQLPAEQVPYVTFGILQASPEATQVPRKQHPSAAHASPAQQGCPGPPQAAQYCLKLPLEQTAPEEQAPLAQQSWPGAPHSEQAAAPASPAQVHLAVSPF